MQSNLPGERILKHVLGKNNILEAGTGELKVLTEKYPYFAAAQFLLAKKYQSENNALCTQQLQKTALHFSNPLWLWYNLTASDTTGAPAVIETGIGESGNASATEALTNETVAEISHENGMFQETEIVEAAGEEIQTVSEIAPPGDIETQEEPVIEVNDKIGDLLKNQLAEYDKPVDENTPLVPEPKQYYRVDYFASQGIKLNPKEEQDNKLDAKVKRFTDWLKQMKRVGPLPADLGTDVASESLVQVSAENSNQAGEVITEAMAEVLARQGKRDKAEELYLKLSLLHPDKSAYFAAQIQELKG